jgi:CBS domain-containing protein
MQIVSDIMTRNVQFVSPHESLRRAAQLMDELNIGALPVCEGDRLVGMVTDRDITIRATSAGIGPDEAVVDDVMSSDVRWCFEDQSIDEVMQQMSDTQIRRVPVVSHDEDHRLLGIVSLGDLATNQTAGIDRILEEVSFPSQPDLSSRGTDADGEITASSTGTATGLAGSDTLDARYNQTAEFVTGADPSDVVEVSPEDLVNRNAPGSTSMRSTTGLSAQDKPEVRRVERKAPDTSTGESGAPGGIDAAGPSGASGGTAGTTGSVGTGIGAAP